MKKSNNLDYYAAGRNRRGIIVNSSRNAKDRVCANEGCDGVIPARVVALAPNVTQCAKCSFHRTGAKNKAQKVAAVRRKAELERRAKAGIVVKRGRPPKKGTVKTAA